MVYSIIGSIGKLFWVFLLLLCTLFFFTIFFLQSIVESYDDIRQNYAHEVDMYYSSVPETMLTLFMCITGGDDWGTRMEPFRAKPIWCLFFIFYIFFMVCGMLNVVVGTFVETASSVAQRDRENVIQNELSKVQEYTRNIGMFFNDADKDRSGTLDWDEFNEHLKDDRVKAYFSSLDLDVSRLKTFFQLLDADDSNQISIDEFVGGCMHLKGTAQTIDVHMLLYETEKMMCKMQDFNHMVESRFSILEEALGVSEETRSAALQHMRAPTGPLKKRHGAAWNVQRSNTGKLGTNSWGASRVIHRAWG